MVRRTFRRILALVLSALAVPVLATEAPVAVSPGDASKLARIADLCPTFNWGGVEGARGFELLVYRLGEGGEPAEEVLRRSFAGAVYGWTPALGSCLERGSRYAWSVRALGPEQASEWSAPNLFEVAAGTSQAEFEAVLQMVREHLGAAAGSQTVAGAPGEGAGEAEAGMEGVSPSPDRGAAGETQLSVDGGVEATSFTGDGSTLTDLAPANLAAAVPVAKGGTGAATAADARTTLGAAAAIHAHTEADITDLAHIPDTVLTEGQVETFVTNGPLDGANFTNLDGSNVTAGTIAEARIDEAIARVGAPVGLHPGPFAAALCKAIDYRYIDRGDGTVLDCNTNLTWLKDAGCVSTGSWDSGAGASSVQGKVADLNSGTDLDCVGYTPGSYDDWRVPRMDELCGMWSDFCVPAGCCTGTTCCTASDGLVDTSFSSPSLGNAEADGQWMTDDAFVAVASVEFWSADERDGSNAWAVDLTDGDVSHALKTEVHVVWPVRGGESGCVPGEEKLCGTNVGACDTGMHVCQVDGTWGTCLDSTSPVPGDACDDGLDNDCDGDFEEGCACTNLEVQPCGSDQGICVRGTQTCAGGVWGDCLDEVEGVAEVCGDGMDNDCDGVIDDGCP